MGIAKESLSPAHSPAVGLATRMRAFAADIKISHTLFALPWALLAMVTAANGWPRWEIFALILWCMVMARTFAMGANRWMDAKLDRLNPRTAGRAIPSGKLSARFVLMMMGLCAAGFIAGTAGFWWIGHNLWPLIFSVPVLVYVGAYPLMKRFTRLCHYYLGGALALAPVCAWVAVSGGTALSPWLMAGAVLSWTAGFDIIYACQDFAVDRQQGLFSVPAKLGIAKALWVSRLTHLICVGFMIALGMATAAYSTFYFVGVGAAVGLLIVEHLLVKPTDLSKVNLSFFTLNGILSLLLAGLGMLDVLM
ncbi:MAG: UbiA family prenyltransferase [Phycisphaerales bacterium]|jgi:4-hydroxybenzoate polyprenyltransferase|nr:UbiA family prenyltransferase [Phycisphaerales bacterium]